jgi:MOSC domain-containing protein YiiM
MSTGRIFQLNRSEGGVPKQALRSVEVTEAGMAGDRQRDHVHHGGPERALCLFSLEHILALQGEGHPIFPGAAGENVTLRGVDWSLMVPGRRLRLGDQVEIEITRYTAPCSTIAEFFSGNAYHRISQKVNPGWSRVSARVLQGGLLEAGQAVTIF